MLDDDVQLDEAGIPIPPPSGLSIASRTRSASVSETIAPMEADIGDDDPPIVETSGEEVTPAHVVCARCASGDDWQQVLLCDGCDEAYHTYCLSPPLSAVPGGDWYCLECCPVFPPDCLSPSSRRHFVGQIRAHMENDSHLGWSDALHRALRSWTQPMSEAEEEEPAVVRFHEHEDDQQLPSVPAPAAPSSPLRFASLDPATGHLMYQPATALTYQTVTSLVEFTQAAEGPHWAAEADEYGLTPAEVARMQAQSERHRRGEKAAEQLRAEPLSNGVSLLVDRQHDMYARVGMTALGAADDSHTHWQSTDYRKVQAGSLLSDDALQRVQMTGQAEAGMAASSEELPFARLLGLTTEAQVMSFLRLYGYWLGNGSLHVSPDRYVTFGPRKPQDKPWVLDHLAALGLTEQAGGGEMVDDKADGILAIHIHDPRWVDYFFGEYASKGGVAPVTSPAATRTGLTASNVQSVKWFWVWVWRLRKERARLVLAGLRCADGSEAQDVSCICTSGHKFRDDLIRLALHAGYSARFDVRYKAGDHRGYDAAGTAIIAQHDCWVVYYSDHLRAAEPILKSHSDIRRLDTPSGVRVWCPTVPPHYLIIARRVRKSAVGVVTQASRPIVVGNCRPYVIHFIVDAFLHQIASLSTHPYGCRVIQRLLEHCSDPQRAAILAELMASIDDLCRNSYGNYVIQHVLIHGSAQHRSAIVQAIRGKLLQLSKHKFASNVVEKCLTGDHQVLTRRGWKPIRAVEVGQEVLSLCAKTVAVEWKAVTATMSHAVDPSSAADRLYRMRGSGMDVIATRDHRMLTAGVDSYGEQPLLPLRYETVGDVLDDAEAARVVVRAGLNRQPPVRLTIPALSELCDRWWAQDRQRGFFQFLGYWLIAGSLDHSTRAVLVAERREGSTSDLVVLLERLFPREWQSRASASAESGRTQLGLQCPPLYSHLRVVADEVAASKADKEGDSSAVELLASTFSRLSRQQAVALLHGCCLATVDDNDGAAQFGDAGEPSGLWVISHSSRALTGSLQLAAHLAEAAVTLSRGVTGHWQLSLSFSPSGRDVPISTVPFAPPVDVTADVDARGYDGYTDDGRVYCIQVEANGSFLTQRLAHSRSSGDPTSSSVQAQPVFVGNCFAHASKEDRDALVDEVMGREGREGAGVVVADGSSSVLIAMVKDQFGNYVIQRLIDVLDEQQKANLVQRIRRFVPQLKKIPYGKHILAKVDKLELQLHAQHHQPLPGGMG